MRLLALEDSEPDSEGRRLSLFRQQASLHHEAAVFIKDARRRFSAIDDFITGLPADAQDECDQVVGGVDPQSAHYHGDWLADHRNVTFHYPEMHPDKAEHGREELTAALEAAAELESSIEAGVYFGSVRFRFADEVAVQWLPDGPEQATLLENLRESVLRCRGSRSARHRHSWSRVRAEPLRRTRSSSSRVSSRFRFAP
jgi:hypothetical protein